MSHLLDTVFERSVCLTKRQVRDYIAGVMAEEECYVAELHLSSCMFCSGAVDGLLPAEAESLKALHELNPDFIGEHVRRTMPQIHLNSMAPAAPAGKPHHHPVPHSWWRMMPVAGALALAFFLLRDRKPGKEQVHHPPHTLQEKAVTPVSPQPLPKERSRAAGSTTGNNHPLPEDQSVPPADKADIAEPGGPWQPQLPLATGQEEEDGLPDASAARAEEDYMAVDTAGRLRRTIAAGPDQEVETKNDTPAAARRFMNRKEHGRNE